MRENIIKDKSFGFAIKIVNLYKELTGKKKEFVLSRQILKSGTSIGANITEALAAQSKKDFRAKLTISFKEAKETKYWLELLKETNYIDKEIYLELITDADELCKILYSIIKS